MTQPILQNKHKNTTVDEIDFTINNILKEFGLSEKNNKVLFNRVVGLQIRKLRIMKSNEFFTMTQSRISEMLNVSFQQVQKYERGLNTVSLDNLKLLSEKTNTDLDFFWSPITTKGLTIKITKGNNAN